MLGILPRLYQLFREVAASLDQECARSHCHITHLQVQNIRCRAQLPLLLWEPFCWTDIYERIECVLHNWLGQAAGRVVRTRRATITTFCDVDGAGRDQYEV